MRKILILFAVLAAAKVWAQDRYYRAAMSDALLAAYRERAVAACQKETSKPGKVQARTQWPAEGGAEVVIGSPHASVPLWEFDNPLWDVRYRHPHVVMMAREPANARCAFDMTAGIASLSGI